MKSNETGATPQSEAWKADLAERAKRSKLIQLVGHGIDPLSTDIGETTRIVTEEVKSRIAAGLTRMNKEDLLDAIAERRDFLAGMNPGMAGTGAYLKHKDAFDAYLTQLESIVNSAEEKD